eukprot:gene16587-18275_t
MSMELVRPGTRVVRGPKWKYGNQDGGDGYVGTITSIVDGKLVVQWDTSGNRRRYTFERELRIFDTATVGVTHNGVICNECNKSNIKGSRWKCSVCYDYDLCNRCYCKGKHSLNHAFNRIDKSRGPMVNVGARQEKLPKAAYGFWEDAVVKRGPDWEWGSQDGGNGKTGKIKKLYNWINLLLNGDGNGATVQWDQSSVCANYRIGADGKVDLIAVRPTSIGTYYEQHLPIIDKDLLHSSDEDSYSFTEGDTVAINVNWDEMKRLQVGHGAVNDDMEETVGRIGTVVSVMPTGDIAVKIVYKIQGILALLAGSSDVESFSAGDKVRVRSNKEVIIKMQEGRGGWNDAMSDSLGKVGDVLGVDDDGDVKVKVNDRQWTFSPAALKKLPFSTADTLHDRNLLPGTDEDSHSFSEGDAVAINVDWEEMKRMQAGHGDVNDDMKECIGQIGKVMRVMPNGDIVMKLFYRAQSRNLLTKLFSRSRSHTTSKLIFWTFNPCCLCKVESFSTGDKVKVRSDKEVIIKMQEGRGGWIDAMSDSLGKVGDVLSVDDDGDVKVNVNGHQWTFSPAALKKLPSSTADSLQGDIRDALLEGLKKLLDGSLGDGNLLIAATKNGDKDTVESILKKDRQADDDGDTALHYAAIGSSLELVKLLIRNKAALDLQNKKGLTALHIAVWKGGVEIVRTLADSSADVNTQDKEGDTPLHDAIAKDRTDLGNCQLELKTCKGHTAIMVAAMEGYIGIMKLLISHGANIFSQIDRPKASPLAIACYLVKEGADLHHCNHAGKSSLDIVTEPAIKNILGKFKEKRMSM